MPPNSIHDSHKELRTLRVNLTSHPRLNLTSHTKRAENVRVQILYSKHIHRSSGLVLLKVLVERILEYEFVINIK